MDRQIVEDSHTIDVPVRHNTIYFPNMPLGLVARAGVPLVKRAEAIANHITISCLYSVFTYLGTLEISLRAKLTSRVKFTESNNYVFPSHKNKQVESPHFHRRYPHNTEQPDSAVTQPSHHGGHQ
jgi:hypothetical protein